MPPLCGAFRNPLSNGSLALGRAAFWGIAFPGGAENAVRYAYYDASIDHAGDAVCCSCAVAAMVAQSAVAKNGPQIVRAGMELFSVDSNALRLSRLAIKAISNGDGPEHVRALMSEASTTPDALDASLNFSLLVAALLLGENDFGKSVRVAASFGCAADQVALAAGAITAQLSGVHQEWLEPLGEAYVAGHGLREIEPPQSLGAFADEIASISKALPDPATSVLETDAPPDSPTLVVSSELEPIEASITRNIPISNATKSLLLQEQNWSSTVLGEVIAKVEYVDPPSNKPGGSNRIIAHFTSASDKELVVEPTFQGPAGWNIAEKLTSFRLKPGESSSFPIVLQSPEGDSAPLVTSASIQVGGSDIPIPLVGSHSWYWVGPFENIEGTGYDKVYRAQDVQNLQEVFNGRSNQPVRWTAIQVPGILFDLEPYFRSGAGVGFLYGKVSLARPGRYKLVCASSTGVVVFLNKSKVISYADTHVPVPRAVLPYVAEIEVEAPFELLIKVLRNLEPLRPMVLYFVAEDGSITNPIAIERMQ